MGRSRGAKEEWKEKGKGDGDGRSVCQDQGGASVCGPSRRNR